MSDEVVLQGGPGHGMKVPQSEFGSDGMCLVYVASHSLTTGYWYKLIDEHAHYAHPHPQ